MDTDSENEDDEFWLFDSCSSSSEDENVVESLKRKAKAKTVGRPSIVSKHPEIIQTIKAFIEQSTSAAHLRRRNDVMYTNGVSLADISKYVFQKHGIVVSKKTIHHLMEPPRRGTTASKRFKSFIHARIPPKRNSKEKKEHPDFHFTSSQVKLVNELSYLCCENTLTLSVDNKNKVEVGIPATSRRSQIRTFYLTDDSPNFVDHDFPHSNSKLVPAGYQILRHRVTRSHSVPPQNNRGNVENLIKRRSRSADSLLLLSKLNRYTCTDKVGRKRLKRPLSGPLKVHLFPSRIIEATNVLHANHLMELILIERKFRSIDNLVLIADGGPDWSVKGIINFLSMGYLWKKLDLDSLVIQCYAPGHSRFNPIERSWSFLTKIIVGVVLPDDIDGKIPDANDTEGWLKVLDNATELCSKFWDRKVYDGFCIKTRTLLSSDSLIEPIKKTHEAFKEFSNTSKRQLKQREDLKALQSMYQFLVKHSNRKAYQLEFFRCSKETCEHCTLLPTRENRFLDIVRLFGGCPVPEESRVYKNHYKSLLEMMRNPKPITMKTTSHGKCDKGCCYHFFSKADRKRHMTLMDH